MLGFRNHLTPWFAGIVLGGILLSAVGATAGEAGDRIPRIGVHRFTPNNSTRDPFIRTFVRNSLGIGQTLDLYLPILEIDDEPVLGLEGDLINAILEFEYQQALKDWVAFRAHIRILGRLGTGVQSLLADGVTANTGYEFGWMFRLHEGEKTALSGTLNVWNATVTKVNLLGYIDGIIEGNSAALVSTVPTTRGGAGLRYAWATSELVGFNFLGEVGVGESTDRSYSDEVFFKLGAAVDFDLLAKTSVPLGLVLSYRVDSYPEGGGDIASDGQEVNFRIGYTGTTDFLISLDLAYEWFTPVAGGETINLATTLLNLRYYF